MTATVATRKPRPGRGKWAGWDPDDRALFERTAAAIRLIRQGLPAARQIIRRTRLDDFPWHHPEPVHDPDTPAALPRLFDPEPTGMCAAEEELATELGLPAIPDHEDGAAS